MSALPFVMMGANLLANRKNEKAARKQAIAEMLEQRTAELGGPTHGIRAANAQNRIDADQQAARAGAFRDFYSAYAQERDEDDERQQARRAVYSRPTSSAGRVGVYGNPSMGTFRVG